MRVTKGDACETTRPDTVRSSARSNAALRVSLLVLVFALGFVSSQQGWHRPLVDFLAAFIHRPAFIATALFHRSDLPTLHVDLDFEDYQRLLDKRDQALRLGVNVATDQDDVPATMRHAGAAAAVQIRLLEGPAAALSGEAWPFEIAVQNDGTLFDLRRFTLVPADDTALSTWGYLETLRRADLLSPRYHLVRLVVNGYDRGLYALEEQPAAELLIAQGRAESVVVTFDQSAYWEAAARLGDALPGSGFQYAQVALAPLDDAGGFVACDDAADLLRALQAGEIAPSAAFDVDRMATLLALTTLWRGTSELDWRTVRFAYDPATTRLEPIAAGAAIAPVAPLPDVFAADPALQVATARALAQFSRPDYLAQLQTDLETDLETLQLAVAVEMGYLELPWPVLEAHQAVMRHQIAPARTLFATIEADETALVLRLGNVQPFPVEIVGLDVGENVLLTVDPTWVAESDRSLLVDVPGAVVLRAAVGSTTHYLHLRVPPEALPTGRELVGQPPGEVRVVTRLFGLETQQVVVTASCFDTGGRSP